MKNIHVDLAKKTPEIICLIMVAPSFQYVHHWCRIKWKNPIDDLQINSLFLLLYFKEKRLQFILNWLFILILILFYKSLSPVFHTEFGYFVN